MEQKHIIKFERGVLYLKLREHFDTANMELHHTMARISRDSIQVVKTDSKGEISSTTMTLTAEEGGKLLQGVETVKRYWTEQPLPNRHVLLDCGCIIDWNEHEKDYTEFTNGSHTYELPYVRKEVWCSDCEEAFIYRFNKADFPEIETQTQAQEAM